MGLGAKVDIFIQRILFEIVEALRIFATLLLGFSFLLMLPLGFFDYEFDLSDISTFEIASLVVVMLLIWRYFKRGALSGLKWTQCCFKIAQLVLVLLLIEALFITLLISFVLFDEGELNLAIYYRYSDTLDLVDVTLTAAFLYIYAPLPKRPLDGAAQTVSINDNVGSSTSSVTEVV